MTFNEPVKGLFSLAGRRALVTGSSRGLGLEFAHALGNAGAAVILNGRSAADLDAAATKLRDGGLNVGTSVFDVTDGSGIDAAVAAIQRDEGPLDILVNNAGIQVRGPLEDFTDSDWDRLMGVNLDGVFKVSRAVVRDMIKRRRGVIINVASVQSELARPSVSPYAASKGAIKMLTKAMAGEWARHGIRVNAIGPGYFRTELNAALTTNLDFSTWLEKRTPMGRWGEPGELAGAAVFLASDAASFVTGQTLYVDGGITSVL